MSDEGVCAATELVGATRELIKNLTLRDWAADSACRGWRVQDLVGHMAFFFNFIADPELILPDNPSGMAERLNDAVVAQNAQWMPAQVIDYYNAQSEIGLETLAALQEEPLRDQPLPLLDLGTYRMAQLADAVAFDHLVHLDSDLFTPTRVSATAQIPVEAAINPALDWMLAGLRGMCGTALAPLLDAPIGLCLTGATDRSFTLARDAADPTTITAAETVQLPDDVAVSDALDFTRWATRRTAWRSAVDLGGDHARVAAVLDAVHVV
ncbi:maleylpyruvate isomerase N-terminal domain-containing protein [Mycobacterium sp. SMC-19]|uniref:maleylpyruvate isomerase N-terminal domain-containing protein n=1 Tax=Mycobacterium sp. SMC-19 TaxID=3381630 RepID=UPI0038761B23